ncbi:MAG: hypothetical protein ACI92Z_002493 [Paracoccaceae bacterium]|jgi:hypothetical protein
MRTARKGISSLDKFFASGGDILGNWKLNATTNLSAFPKYPAGSPRAYWARKISNGASAPQFLQCVCIDSLQTPGSQVILPQTDG